LNFLFTPHTAFNDFRVKAESLTGRKIQRLCTDHAYESMAWATYCREHSILHEFTAPYSSAQNGLAERTIRTTMDDVRTLLRDSGLGHSYWAEAAAYSVETCNLIPSHQHSGQIPLELFSSKQQDVSHLHVFGSKCWAKIPTVHGVQVTGGYKLDVCSMECVFLGYASGLGSYRVQDVASRRVFVFRDVVLEEGYPHRTSPTVGEQIPLFDTLGRDIMVSNSKQKEQGCEVEEPGDPNNGHTTPDVNVNESLRSNSEFISGNDDPGNIVNAGYEVPVALNIPPQ